MSATDRRPSHLLLQWYCRPLSLTREGLYERERRQAVFHQPMILFQHIVQIFAVPEHTGLGEHAFLLKGLESRRICSVLVHDDHTRGDCMRGLEHLAESVLEMSLEAKSRETMVSGWKGPSMYGRNLGTSARCSYG